MQYNTFTTKTWLMLLKGIFHNKTPIRILTLDALENISLDGKIIDLGSGTGKHSYHNHITYGENASIIKTDFFDEGEGVIKLNLEDKFNLEDNSFDHALCFNVYEHIFNYQQMTHEINRILKKGGSMVGFVPFSIGYHPDPDDYCRFTYRYLEKHFNEANFSHVKITCFALGPFFLLYYHMRFFIPKILKLRFLLFILMSPLFLVDYLYVKCRPKFKVRCILGNFFEVKK